MYSINNEQIHVQIHRSIQKHACSSAKSKLDTVTSLAIIASSSRRDTDADCGVVTWSITPMSKVQEGVCDNSIA